MLMLLFNWKCVFHIYSSRWGGVNVARRKSVRGIMINIKRVQTLVALFRSL